MFGRGLPPEISACCRVICHVEEISSSCRRSPLPRITALTPVSPLQAASPLLLLSPARGLSCFYFLLLFLSPRTVKINLQRYSVIFL